VDEPCSIHKNKTIEVYCGDHDKLCCSVCFATQHRKCERVEAIEDACSRFDRTGMEVRLEKISKSLEMLETFQESNREQGERLKARKKVVCQDVADKIDQVKEALDEGFTRWQKQFEQKHRDCLQTLDIACDEMRRFSTTLKEARFTLSIIKEKGSLKQLFLMTHKLESQIAEHFQRLKLKMEVETFSDYQHDMTSEFTVFVSSTEKIPDVKCVQSKATCGTMAQLNNVVSPHFLTLPKPWLANMDLMKIIPQKVSEHSIHSYYGLLRYNDTLVLSVDKTIQIYDVRGSSWIHAYTEVCDDSPYAIVQANARHEVFVAFGSHIAVYNIDERNQMSLLRTIPMSPSGVTINSFTLVDDTVICVDNSGLTILNPDFTVKEKRNFTIEGFVTYVASSNKTKNIAFLKKTGNGECTVTSQNLSGITNFEYTIKSTSLRGIAFDSQDNIYVCDFKEKKELVQISFDGKKSRSIRTEISDPYSISFHPEGHRFLVLSTIVTKKCCIYEIPQAEM
jgi:hypothetical protein